MSSVFGDEFNPGGEDEKIFVSVRLRPLNAKEIAKDDPSDWECVSDTTIVCKTGVTERSAYPNSYTFDRVYNGECTTQQVYEEGAKRVALSAISGINSSIFAYGQTSSGKTYTMTGVTKYAMQDIFDHIKKQVDREFVLKFSAIEIYNENVKDLLSADGTPLRLLDDPEKGTVVDKLTEIQLENWSHLMELLAVCEAQRKIGETSMNEISSRSHQIIRLTIESCANDFSGIGSATSLSAVVNFIDLAGSERASQTKVAGTRLKEGAHINRSLLTLGTVIRKLSKGGPGHVPYRDSKLTRIIQNSLGGNARTAIICTLSPARTHLEQSRNTLVFAVCAKQVTTSAQVNVVVSEKALVKQLQREMARLENELKNMSANSNRSNPQVILHEKEVQIQKMELEIQDLTRERDLARNRLEEILRVTEVDPNLIPFDQNLIPLNDVNYLSGHRHRDSWDEHSISDDISELELAVENELNTYFPKNLKLLNTHEDHSFDNITPRQFMNQYLRPDQKVMTRTNSIVSSKEVDFIEKVKENDEKVKENDADDEKVKENDANDEKVKENDANDEKVKNLVNETRDDGNGNDTRVDNSRSESGSVVEGDESASSSAPSPLIEGENENVVVESESKSNIEELSVSVEKEMEEKKDEGSLVNSPKTLEKVMKYDLRGRGEDYVIDATPRASDLEEGEKEKFDDVKETFAEIEKEWSKEFLEERRKIIELWDECNIPLLHRTYFFLLIKGDTSDSVYIEVELRRLAFLKKTVDHVASARALNLERAMLSRKMLRQYTPKEREELFEKWGIDLESRNRRYQLAQLLWTKTDDIDHVTDSAQIVAKLVGFIEPDNAPIELFALSVAPKQETETETEGIFSSWRNSLSLLRSSYYT